MVHGKIIFQKTTHFEELESLLLSRKPFTVPKNKRTVSFIYLSLGLRLGLRTLKPFKGTFPWIRCEFVQGLTQLDQNLVHQYEGSQMVMYH